MKGQRHTELPRFIVGALATAGASAANGATVQITFANNVVSSATGLTSFAADLTGDTENDINGKANGTYAALSTLAGPTGSVALAKSSRFSLGASGSLGNGQWTHPGESPARGRNLVPFTFTDARINGGAATAGWLEVEAVAELYEGGFLQIHRLIFDDESTSAPSDVAYTDGPYPAWQVSAVPEPGGNLALLALGAGGLTLRRRLKRAA